MNIYDFAETLFKLYPNSYNAENKALKQKRYVKTLDNPKTDFNKLLDYISQNHKSEFMPTEAQLKEWSQYCPFKGQACSWLHVKVYNPKYKTVINTDCFPNHTTSEEMLKIYNKKFPTLKGWRIEEIK